MIKNISKFTLLLTICTLLKLSFSSEAFIALLNPETKEVAKVEVSNRVFAYNTPKEKFTPTLGKSFVGFKEALAFKESRGDYFTVNKFGYLGKYQFGAETLKLIGIYNPNQFLQNPELQEKAFIANAERNKWILRRDIKRFNGMTINGVLVTESGILAAAHLAGPGSVKKYLRSYGAVGFEDAFGTSIKYYMKKFSGYDTSILKANKKAKATSIV
ncbi:lytic transglycosylase domain-containing protein [Lacinutrix sp. C3R15]|uniref:lytic transglycosylase domain-containing protein n=1 Tax=Flavobacteriaceae TaxID=49546 RepID=UPI001C09FD0E|nr:MULTISPECIES: lytic transglycosylase domain-containing protein [Flavobacteriaceae]MBU2940643.1 lytic transglycosylase domain-containing protein [Lacinutrix sp. C3R15]MDO6623961.1 lytic transglycosylase domain-containing protein [Oceanihabitans sp. 1_MG-2023]